MNNDLQKLKDTTAVAAFGITKAEAIEQNICINCKKPPTVYSDLGLKEYQISGICEPCFGKIAGAPDNED
jgi:hypothetical protein